MNDHLKVIVPAEEKTDTADHAPDDVNYDDAFFVHPENETVTWIYYNPDSNAGGQYVTNVLSFDEIRAASELYSEPDEFFDYLGSIADQELADIDSEWFKGADEAFRSPSQYQDCTKETMPAY